MKKFLAAFLFVAFSAVAASAQSAIPPAGTPHNVQATWTAPTTPGGSGVIAGYNIYRAGVSYTKINTALNTTTSFVDTTVVSGATYSYCVTTVDSKNEESACSLPASTTIPANPNGPTTIIIVTQ
jgi:fibronectin type 3 domain-containing protein